LVGGWTTRGEKGSTLGLDLLSTQPGVSNKRERANGADRQGTEPGIKPSSRREGPRQVGESARGVPCLPQENKGETGTQRECSSTPLIFDCKLEKKVYPIEWSACSVEDEHLQPFKSTNVPKLTVAWKPEGLLGPGWKIVYKYCSSAVSDREKSNYRLLNADASSRNWGQLGELWRKYAKGGSQRTILSPRSARERKYQLKYTEQGGGNNNLASMENTHKRGRDRDNRTSLYLSTTTGSPRGKPRPLPLSYATIFKSLREP